MDWVMFFEALFIIGICFYMFGALELYLAILYGAVKSGVTFYKKLMQALFALEDRVSDKAQENRRRVFFRLCLIAELIFTVLAFIFSKDRAQLAFSILSATPTGGVLTFFYDPNGFYVGSTASLWLLSGISFILISVLSREIEKVETIKAVRFIHIISMTFVAGIICNTVVVYGIEQYAVFMDWALQAFPVYIRLLAYLLRILYYAAGLVMLGMAVQAFVDTLKAMGVIFAIEAVFVVVATLTSIFIQAGFLQHAEALQAIMNGINYVVFELPKQNAFWAQMILTVVFNLLYSYGLTVVEAISTPLTPEEKERFEEERRRKHIMRDYYSVADIAKKSKLGMLIFKKSQPEEYEKYLQVIAKYGSFEELARLADEVRRLEEEEKAERAAARQSEHPEESSEVAVPEDVSVVRQELQEDIAARIPTGYAQKLARMPVKRLCGRFHPDSAFLDRMDTVVMGSKFLKYRSMPLEGKTLYSDLVMSYCIIFGCLCFLLMWAAVMTHNEILLSIQAGLVYIALAAALWYPFFYVIGVPLSFLKISWSVPAVLAGVLSVWFSFMLSGFFIDLASGSMLIMPILVSVVNGILAIVVTGTDFARRTLTKFRFFQKRERRRIYRTIPVGDFETSLTPPGTKKPAKFEQKLMAEAICFCARREEVEAYLGLRRDDV